jgi:hypothetical protein
MLAGRRKVDFRDPAALAVFAGVWREGRADGA